MYAMHLQYATSPCDINMLDDVITNDVRNAHNSIIVIAIDSSQSYVTRGHAYTPLDRTTYIFQYVMRLTQRTTLCVAYIHTLGGT